MEQIGRGTSGTREELTYAGEEAFGIFGDDANTSPHIHIIFLRSVSLDDVSCGGVKGFDNESVKFQVFEL
jgi:hypothetical protein